MRDRVNKLAARVGSDPLLVQGAGGNISWKDGGSIFIKGSGTWLAEALSRDIYIDMDLNAVRQKIAEGGTDYLPAIRYGPVGLRPSIETALHALLPHRVVLHLHPVDVIALSVIPEAVVSIAARLERVDWEWVDYAKPGKELADAIARRIVLHNVVPRVWVLGNHGLVVGEESVGALEALLEKVMARLRLPVCILQERTAILGTVAKTWDRAGYRFVEDGFIYALALDGRAMELCRQAWVLYPDHAVFLGDRCWLDKSPVQIPEEDPPVVAIVPGVGVCIRKDAPKAAQSMLSCYAEVLLRLPAGMPRALSPESVSELLHWDAEKFRKAMQTNV